MQYRSVFPTLQQIMTCQGLNLHLILIYMKGNLCIKRRDEFTRVPLNEIISDKAWISYQIGCVI